MMKASSARPLPPPPRSFSQRKERILELLAVPDAEYSDTSPKGSVDEGIRELIGEINALEGYVTTSSCAGRVSVFVEGRKARDDVGEKEVGEEEEEEGNGDGARRATLAAVGGKGGGGAWLFVSHDPVVVDGDDESRRGEDVKRLLGLCDSMESKEVLGDMGEVSSSSKDTRLVHFKFEPMILHVLTASLEHAQLLLRCGLQAGFRESGAINLLPSSSSSSSTTSTAEVATATPIVAIRSMGLSLESLIGVQEDGRTKCTVSEDYLYSLLRIANERFEENRKRIERFRTAVLDASYPFKKKDGTEWEDARARRERKRAEGLRRKAELQGQSGKGEVEVGDADLDFPVNTDFT